MRFALFLSLVAIAAAEDSSPHVIPFLSDLGLTDQQVRQFFYPPSKAGANNICMLATLDAAQIVFNNALGIDPSIGIGQSNSLNRYVNNKLLNGTEGLVSVCSARQQFVSILAGTYPYCIDPLYLVSVGDDYNDAIYYTHLYRHLEFICSGGFQSFSNGIPCIKINQQQNPAISACFTTFNNAVNTNPNGFCDITETLILCIQNAYGNCGVATAWTECELERVGFAPDCPNLSCPSPN